MEKIKCTRCNGAGTIEIPHGTIDCPQCNGIGSMESKTKQILVMRKDLGMSRGKLVAQGSHASMKCIFDNYIKISLVGRIVGHKVEKIPYDVAKWFDGSFTKVTLRVDSEEELLELYNKLKDTNIPIGLVKDAGRTEFSKPEYTCLGIGPWNNEKIDKFTGHLPLYK